jgi:hypothetical protein
MNSLKIVSRELVGLFVDDGSLALEIMAAVASAAIFQTEIPRMPLVSGGILLFGCLGLLLVNVWRSQSSASLLNALRDAPNLRI